MPVRVSGKGSGTVRLYVLDPATGKAKDQLVTVRPGGSSIDVKVQVKGNKRYAWDASHDVLVKAVRGTVIGSHAGGVLAENDDPMPKITVKSVADKVTEGQPLKWQISLSAPADVELTKTLQIVPVPGSPELSTKDVDKQWLLDMLGEVPDGEVPLSKLEYASLWTAIPPGKTSAEVPVPTVRDQVAEPTEYVGLQPTDDEGNPQGPVLKGTVRDAP